MKVQKLFNAFFLILASLIAPSVLSSQDANSIVTEEELAERAIAENSAKQKAMDELTWKNYTNSEFGFSIEYPEPFDSPTILPSDWSEGDMTVTTGPYGFLFSNYKTVENSFLPSFSATLWVYLADSFDKTLRQFMYEDYFFPGSLSMPIQQPTEIVVAGNTSGLEFLTKGPLVDPGKIVGFVHDKYLYVFGSEDLDSKNTNILYDHMLKSIKFVNILDSDNENDQSDSEESHREDNENDDGRSNDDDDDN
jgi:hypothetical protein